MKVAPITGSEGGIPLASLNPDTDGDGQIAPWEKQMYDNLVAADTDSTGTLSVRNLFDLMRKMQNEVAEASKGGIPISSLNPDSDGDGKVEKWEVEVFTRIKDADADQSGSISVKELFGVIKGAAESDRQKRLFRRLFIVAVLIIFFLIGAMLGMGIVAGEAVKESHVPDCSDPDAADYNAVYCDPENVVSVGTVESFVETIFDLPTMPTNQLAYLKDINMYVDMTSVASVGGAVEASFKIAGAFKRDDTYATLVTSNGYTIALDTTAQTGTITMDGVSYPVMEEAPESGRRLETEDLGPIATLTAKQLVRSHESRRRLARRAAFLATSTLTLSSGGGSATGNSRRLESDEADNAPSSKRRLARRAAFLSTTGTYTLSSGGGADYGNSRRMLSGWM